MLSCEAIRLFLDDREASNCRPATITYYRNQLGRLLADHAELPLSPAALRAILARVKGRPASRHTAYRALRALYLWLLAQSYITENPLSLVTAPRVPRIRQRTLDPGDVVNLLDVEQSPRDLAIVALLLATGIRSGELRTLTGRDIHEGYIKVNGKTGDRLVPVHPEILALVKGQARLASEPVFRTLDNRPLSTDRLYRIVRKAFGRAGFDLTQKSGPHCLRHTYGRSWVASHGPLPSLQTIMGHANISTTALYTSLAVEEVESDYRQFSRLTKSIKPPLRRVV
jgi:integrase/recombinase XerC